MGIEQFIPVGSKNAIKREDLRILSGLPDRKLRDAINKSEALIINMQDGSGYFIPADNETELVKQWESTSWKRIRTQRERALKAKEWREGHNCPGEEDDQMWVRSSQ